MYSKWRSRSSNALKPGTKAAEWWGRFASDGQGHGFIKLRPSSGNCPRDPVTLRKPFSLHLSLQTSSLRHTYNCLIPTDTPLNFLLSQSIKPLVCLLPKTRLLERATLRRNSGALHKNFTCFRTIFPSLIIAPIHLRSTNIHHGFLSAEARECKTHCSNLRPHRLAKLRLTTHICPEA